MRRRGPFCFYAFDLLWLDDTDLRSLALSGRKALLRKLLPRKAHAVRYVEHVTTGTDLFRVICDRDMEEIVAQAGQRQVHAEGDHLGEDQEPVEALRRKARFARRTVVRLI
jgi:ATP-dependent DNA ligase